VVNLYAFLNLKTDRCQDWLHSPAILQLKNLHGHRLRGSVSPVAGLEMGRNCASGRKTSDSSCDNY
jgi:hypothetical protein